MSPLLFAIVVGVVTENVRKGLMKEVLYADDLVLISETMQGLKERFLKWKSALENKGLKMNLEKAKVMVWGSDGEVIQSRIYPCAICDKRVTVNSMLCTKCNQQIYGKCSKFKKSNSNFSKIFFICNKCDKATNGVGEEQQEVMYDEVATVKDFAVLAIG